MVPVLTGRISVALQLLALGLIAAVAGALVVVSAPAAMAGAGLLLLGPPLLTSPTFRLVVIATGAFLVFQSEADSAKLGYLGIAVVCAVLAIINIGRDSDPVIRAFLPMIGCASALVVYLIIGTGVVAYANGISSADWVRDVLGYLLVAILPVVGLDAARTTTPAVLGRLIGVCGVVAAVGFATDWLSRRGVSESAGRFVLASATFCIFAFAYVLVRGTVGHGTRWPWLAAAIIIPIALIVTGTRTHLLLLAAVLLGVMGAQSKYRLPPRKVLGYGLIGGLVGYFVIPVISSRYLGEGFLSGRYFASLSSGLATDLSFQARERSYALAHERWLDNFWFGGGPGYSYPGRGFSLDTPWLIPAKIGIVGCLLLLAYLAAMTLAIGRTKRQPAAIYTAGRGLTFALVALLPFGPWVEDKGTAIVFTFLVATSVATARTVRNENNSIRNVLAPVASGKPAAGPPPSVRRVETASYS